MKLKEVLHLEGRRIRVNGIEYIIIQFNQTYNKVVLESTYNNKKEVYTFDWFSDLLEDNNTEIIVSPSQAKMFHEIENRWPGNGSSTWSETILKRNPMYYKWGERRGLNTLRHSYLSVIEE